MKTGVRGRSLGRCPAVHCLRPSVLPSVRSSDDRGRQSASICPQSPDSVVVCVTDSPRRRRRRRGDRELCWRNAIVRRRCCRCLTTAARRRQCPSRRQSERVTARTRCGLVSPSELARRPSTSDGARDAVDIVVDISRRDDNITTGRRYVVHIYNPR